MKKVNTGWLWHITFYLQTQISDSMLGEKKTSLIPLPAGTAVWSARRCSSVPSITWGGDHSALVIPRHDNKTQVWLYFTWLLGYNKLQVQRPGGNLQMKYRSSSSLRKKKERKKENTAADVERRIYLKLIVFERRSGARVDLILQALVQISAF